MKKTILTVGLFASLSTFAQSMKPPASTQKVSNTTLTCPSGKWCKVLVHVSMTPKYTGPNMVDLTVSGGTGVIAAPYPQITALNDTFELILKSGEALNCATGPISTGGVGSNNISSWFPYLSCTVGGTQFYKGYIGVYFTAGSSSPTLNNVFALATDYSFYSMEYFN